MTPTDIEKLPTPLTDAEQEDLGTGIKWVDADHARRLERDRAALIEALKLAIQRSIRQPNAQFAYHRCYQCSSAWFGPKEGRSNPERPRHRLDCVVLEWEETLAAVKERK